MELEFIRRSLGWILVLNLGLLFAWFGMFLIARDWIYKIHRKWFAIPEEKFDTIHYCFMGAFELFVFALFLAPYLALRIIG